MPLVKPQSHFPLPKTMQHSAGSLLLRKGRGSPGTTCLRGCGTPSRSCSAVFPQSKSFRSSCRSSLSWAMSSQRTPPPDGEEASSQNLPPSTMFYIWYTDLGLLPFGASTRHQFPFLLFPHGFLVNNIYHISMLDSSLSDSFYFPSSPHLKLTILNTPRRKSKIGENRAGVLALPTLEVSTSLQCFPVVAGKFSLW